MLDKLKGWMPDRKILLGGVSAILAWAALHGAYVEWHFDPQPIIDSLWAVIAPGQASPAAQPLLAGIIAWAVAYLAPASAKDIVKKIDDDIALVAGYIPASAKQPDAPRPPS